MRWSFVSALLVALSGLQHAAAAKNVCPGFAPIFGGNGFLWGNKRIVTPTHVRSVASELREESKDQILFDVHNTKTGKLERLVNTIKLNTAADAGYKGGFRSRDLKIQRLLEPATLNIPTVPVWPQCHMPPNGSQVQVMTGRVHGRGGRANCVVVDATLTGGTPRNMEITFGSDFKVSAGHSGSTIVWGGRFIIGMIHTGSGNKGHGTLLTDRQSCKECFLDGKKLPDNVCGCNGPVSLPLVEKGGRC